MCLTIVGIPCHLIQRLYVWAAQTGEEAAVQSQADKVIAKVAQLVKEEKDPKRRKLIRMHLIISLSSRRSSTIEMHSN